MALSRIKTWTTSEDLDAADLNAEFDNIVNKFGYLTVADFNTSSMVEAIDYYLAGTNNLETVVAAAKAVDKHLYLPESSSPYTADKFNLPDNFIIQGAGIDKTIIAPSDSQPDATFLTIGGGSYNGRNIHIKDLTIQSDSGDPANLILISILHATATVERNIKFTNVKFVNQSTGTTYCVQSLNGSANVPRDQISFRNCTFVDATYGVRFTDAPVRVEIKNCYFENTDYGVYYGSGSDREWLIVENCRFEGTGSATAPSVYFNSGGVVRQNVFHAPSSMASGYIIYASNASKRLILIEDNIFRIPSASGADWGVYFNTDYVVIKNNRVGEGAFDEETVYLGAGSVITTAVATVWEANYNSSTGLSYDTVTTSHRDQRKCGIDKVYNGYNKIGMHDNRGGYSQGQFNEANRVDLWLYHTGTTNTLAFRKRSLIYAPAVMPTAGNDWTAYVDMTGTTSLL